MWHDLISGVLLSYLVQFIVVLTAFSTLFNFPFVDIFFFPPGYFKLWCVNGSAVYQSPQLMDFPHALCSHHRHTAYGPCCVV